MNNLEYTKGPWSIQKTTKGIFINAHANIGEVSFKHYGIIEAEANAKLIAMSPVMIEELRNEIDFLLTLRGRVPSILIYKRIEKLKSVIEKAGGIIF